MLKIIVAAILHPIQNCTNVGEFPVDESRTEYLLKLADGYENWIAFSRQQHSDPCLQYWNTSCVSKYLIVFFQTRNLTQRDQENLGSSHG